MGKLERLRDGSFGTGVTGVLGWRGGAEKVRSTQPFRLYGDGRREERHFVECGVLAVDPLRNAFQEWRVNGDSRVPILACLVDEGVELSYDDGPLSVPVVSRVELVVVLRVQRQHDGMIGPQFAHRASDFSATCSICVENLALLTAEVRDTGRMGRSDGVGIVVVCHFFVR